MIFVKNEVLDLCGLDQLDLAFPERLFDSTYVQSEISHATPNFMFYAARLPRPVKKTIKKMLRMRG